MNNTLSVKKRCGKIVPFDIAKIRQALVKAYQSSQSGLFLSQELIDNVFLKIELFCERTNQHCLHIEEIQSFVEKELFKTGHESVYRAYVVYREQHKLIRENKNTNINVVSSISDYLTRADWRVNANANQDYSLGGLILNSAGKMIANYWLSHVYPPEVGNAHREADIHIHDLDFLSGYCAGWSLRMLLQEGLGGVKNRVSATPPTHLNAAIGQIVNFLGTLQNEWAGAQAFSSFDTYLAPYVRKDNLDYRQVKQSIQALIFNLNVPSRWGSQSPFTNLTFDWVCPDDLLTQIPVIAGIEQPFVYGELQQEMDMINKAFIEVMLKGDVNERVFTFPIPTYNITKNFNWHSPNANLLMELVAKYGVGYFQNFVNSELKPHHIRSMCCRLQLDVNELLKRGNGLFGSAEQTGSIGVVTINCARLGYLSRHDTTLDNLYKRLDVLLELAKNSLEIKRKVIQRHIDNGLFPYTKRYLGILRNHFSTIGVNGMNEMVTNLTRYSSKSDLTDATGQQLAIEFLTHIRNKLKLFQEETGHMYNLEATPAEGTTYRFAKEDQKRFDGILQAGTKDAPYYTNSSQLPVGYTTDLFAALDNQEHLQAMYTGGTVFHIYAGERTSADGVRTLLKRCIENYKIPYFTFSPTFSICPKHGYLVGEWQYCPKCDALLIGSKTT